MLLLYILYLCIIIPLLNKYYNYININEGCDCVKELDFALIGRRIKEVRSEKHLTQEFLAKMTDVNVSHISNIETNKVKVSLTLLVNICNSLDVTLDYLLENEYHSPTSVTEKELLNTIKDMDNVKLETLLRIAKVL